MPKVYETSERAKKEFLKTRYYKGNADVILLFLENYFKEKKNFKIISLNKDYGELAVSCDNYDMTIKVFQFSITEVSVDVFMDSRFLFDFSKSKNAINEFYNDIAKKFEFLGLSRGI